jgi:hypothetical protein
MKWGMQLIGYIPHFDRMYYLEFVMCLRCCILALFVAELSVRESGEME